MRRIPSKPSILSETTQASPPHRARTTRQLALTQEELRILLATVRFHRQHVSDPALRGALQSAERKLDRLMSAAAPQAPAA